MTRSYSGDILSTSCHVISVRKASSLISPPVSSWGCAIIFLDEEADAEDFLVCLLIERAVARETSMHATPVRRASIMAAGLR